MDKSGLVPSSRRLGSARGQEDPPPAHSQRASSLTASDVGGNAVISPRTTGGRRVLIFGRPSGTSLSNSMVPDIPFEKRIQQPQAFKADTGTLDIDHNYEHCSNLGGWAVEIAA